MRTPYSFSVLRYVHDPVTQEFLNIGVAVYLRETGFLRAICTTHYARITRMFTKIDGNRFRQLTRYIQDQVSAVGESLPSELPFEPGRAIEQLLARVLPPDDSSIQFSPAGVGLSHDLEKTAAELFERYVERYAFTDDSSRRDDEAIWRSFREPLDRRQVTAHLTPKRIVAPNYEYEFQRAWKNQVWHVYEPVSFDMVDGSSIVEKANRWVGRATSLNDSTENFEIHLLLGEPRDRRFQDTYIKAQNILRKMPGKHELIPESDAEAFAEELEKEVRKHEKPG
ncbi:MAG TPA: DUF3037 domain-containing protein [Bryobacteraceae bacterium]|nr:DUF3037 domain-containing protein [Bryobacteraceae bacterium]